MGKMGKIYKATVIGYPNIAVIKYWGKRNKELNLPQEGSISFTLDSFKGDLSLCTITTVAFAEGLDKDRLYINGEEATGSEVEERLKTLDLIRKATGVDMHAIIASINTFPTSAGLASSASGISAMVFGATEALKGFKQLSFEEIANITRIGSGSSCRSLLGGFVYWRKGERDDGKDSIPTQIAPHSHWPELLDVIAIVESGKKKVSSRAGMNQTVATSILYPARLKYLPKALEETIEAVKNRDFSKLGEIAMRDSNNMHATMLDTWPPIFYMNDTSKEIVYAIHDLNEKEGKIIAAYTFDAGPNAHVLTTRENMDKVIETLKAIEGVKEIIVAKVGEGPVIVNDEMFEHLLLDENLNPKKLSDAEMAKIKELNLSSIRYEKPNFSNINSTK